MFRIKFRILDIVVWNRCTGWWDEWRVIPGVVEGILVSISHQAKVKYMAGSSNLGYSSSSDDEIEEWKLYQLVQARKRQMLRIDRNLCRTSALTGDDYTREILTGHCARILENCRITVDTFRRLCNILREGHYVSEHHQRQVSVEESLAMFLTLIGTDGRMRVIAERFQHSTETVDRHIALIVKAFVRLAPTIIAPRNEIPVHPRIRDSTKFYPWFKDCVGAIDGTHVPAFVPAAYQDAFRNRKGNITQNVLVACDHDMRFIFVYAGWEGSAHDSRILQSALSRQGVNFPMPPLGKYYVVDSAYKNMPGFMAPFRGVRYHMQDFTGRGRAPRTPEEYFNHIHSSLRNVIERSFGCLKRRFAFLKGPMNNYSLRNQIYFVIACCVLHNFIKEVQLEDDIIREFANEELEVEQEGENEDIDGNQNRLEEIDTSDGAIFQWNNRRITMATQMWNASRSSG